MIEDSSIAPQSLNALCQQANLRAAGWQSATASGGSATLAAHPERPQRGLLKWGLMSGFSALALAVLAAQLDTGSVPRTAAVQADAVPHRLSPLPSPQPPATSIRAAPQGDESATQGTASTPSNPGADSQPDAGPAHTAPGEIESQPGGSC